MSIYFTLDDDFAPIIREALPNATVTDMHQITTGWTNIVYEVETDKGNYFFRFPRDEFWSRTIVKDCEFADFIKGKTNFHTSELELHRDNGRPFSVHKKIEGTPLADKMKDLSDEELKQVSEEIAQFMAELHQVEYTDEHIFDIDNIGLDLHSFLTELLAKHVSREDMEFWKHVTAVEPQCLVHGDLNLSNVLLDENNHIAAVIDFGFSGYGNKYDDVARILSRDTDRNFKNDVIEAYEAYTKSPLDKDLLENKIAEWNNIDQGYITYMRGIGIYE
ncbi:phosphotransferase family protein [Bifidobacterium magnum]|uniref:Aminoglycoside phosphotransferase n=1 Tax=Bifidobacterium magnum TaxID=1692 RepID=A0A087BEY2_9BIFI|nr:aminoglycoside phosphotransferase family protein [Bifidobacterium magnum]KFI69582.1 Aminoglycoside phosphotransferase [Bifidobacterium magnum]